ncbi:MAG: amino acid permease [Luteitalea sp.]|nr:amino acid permease [Luteitalea sp.]
MPCSHPNVDRMNRSSPTLRRALGRWDLTAIGVNQVIGSAVFLAPAALAAQVGGWATPGLVLVAGLALLIALCFAEAGSRFDGTGGAYLYTRAAFGRFVGFEVGWMLWVTRATSWAAVVNGLTDSLGYYWPAVAAGGWRLAFITAVVLAIMAINIRGIRQSAWTVNALTISKLTPLVIFVVVGLPFVSWSLLRPGATPSVEQISGSALLLIFAFGGYEVVPVPAGEARDPRRAVPFAMIMTIVIVALVMTLVLIVAVGTLPNLAQSRTPLAEAAVLFLGAFGALLMTTGAVASMTGNNMGQALSGSRNLFALAEQGDLPRAFGYIHPRFRTPIVAIVVTCLVSLALALWSDFRALAATSAVSRLLVYAGTCASVLVLRREGRAPFTIAFGPLVPSIALAISVGILYGASSLQLQVGAAALAIGALLYAVAARQKR